MNNFDVTFMDLDGTPAAQAGSHPFATTTSLGTNFSGEEPEGRLRELFLEEIPGLVGDTTAYPRCTAEGFNALVDGVNDCPLETAVGISANSFGEPGHWLTAPVFNLSPPPGVLMRLGFRVANAANVVVDLALNPAPPYDVVASIGDVPEAIKLFGAKLQLWGDPANRVHDGLRGACGVYAKSLAPGDIAGFEFEGQSLSCPVHETPRPLLTLPTSCEGPQATFYDAISWDGDEDFGGALTHDGAGSPMGFVDCDLLRFDPLATVELTTEAAGSSTGLEVSAAFVDEGLAFRGGKAQSQVRDLALALPEGMTAGPSLTASSGCSEADVEAETPESAPGAGCPAGSRVGTAEVESPLLDEPIDGTIYRATPNENFADSLLALYVVLKNADLGVVVVQPVALETDPGTGQLLAIAEEMPQLPFSDLTLHLDDGKGGPLVSPPRCGKYETEAEFDPWAGGGTFISLSVFQISSGPNGGPCPTGTHEDAPPSASGPGVSLSLVTHRHRCHKGKHRVRRHGKTHCVRTHRRHKPHGR